MKKHKGIILISDSGFRVSPLKDFVDELPREERLLLYSVKQQGDRLTLVWKQQVPRSWKIRGGSRIRLSGEEHYRVVNVKRGTVRLAME